MSSNPSYRPPSRIVAIPYAGYRMCIECDLPFYAEVSTQMMCKPCQVEGYWKTQPVSGKPERTATCEVCGQQFTPKSRGKRVRFCNDPETRCRAIGRARDRGEQKPPPTVRPASDEPITWQSPPGDTPCAVCDTGFTPEYPTQVTCNSRCSEARKRERNREYARQSWERKKRKEGAR